jgi:multiple antibiotic resistance protein
MITYIHSFIHLAFTGFIALFPVVNPLGTAFIVNPYFNQLSQQERIKAVKRITFYSIYSERAW